MRRSALLLAVLLVVCALSGCSFGGCFFHAGDSSERQFQLRGQILRVNKDDGTVTIRHEDIKGFMPAMTMPFKVIDKRLLDGRVRGDLVKGTLRVTDTDAYLIALDLTGHADVTGVAATEPTPSGAATHSPDVLAVGDLVPDARLIAAGGRPFQFSSLRGSVVAVTFIYTRCPLPQFCPLLDRQFAAVIGRLRDDTRLRQSVRLLSISFDPEYDTPAVLAAHARAVGADGVLWAFATADPPTLDAFAPRFGLMVVREADNSVTHNMRTAVIDRQGRLVKIYNGSEWTVDQLMADLQKAAGTS